MDNYLYNVIATVEIEGGIFEKIEQIEAKDKCMITIMHAFKKKFNKSRRNLSKKYMITRFKYNLIASTEPKE